MLKRISIIFCCCALAFTFSYIHHPDAKLLPVMSVPVTNKVIIIDAGHGKPDERCY